MISRADTRTLADEQYVQIDVAAIALGVKRRRAYALAKRDNWRHDHGRPKGYLFADVRTTARTETTTARPRTDPMP